MHRPVRSTNVEAERESAHASRRGPGASEQRSARAARASSGRAPRMSSTGPQMLIIIGADHGGVELKDALIAELRARGEEVLDVGTSGPASVDYTDYARAVAERVSRGEAARGVLVCTSGIGMSIAANKFPGVRAALVADATAARMAAEHNDANLLVFGGGLTGKFHARELLRIFLETPFAGGRHQRRGGKIADIERELGLGPAKGALR